MPQMALLFFLCCFASAVLGCTQFGCSPRQDFVSPFALPPFSSSYSIALVRSWNLPYSGTSVPPSYDAQTGRIYASSPAGKLAYLSVSSADSMVECSSVKVSLSMPVVIARKAGRIIFVDGQGLLSATDISCQLLWEMPNYQVTSNPVYVEDKGLLFMVAQVRGNPNYVSIVAADVASGHVQWAQSLSGNALTLAPLTICASSVFSISASSGGSQISSFDVSSGAMLWSSPLGANSNGYSNMFLSSDCSALYVCGGNDIMHLNASSGTSFGNSNLPSNLFLSQYAFFASSGVAVGTSGSSFGGGIAAVIPSSGSVLWQAQPDAASSATSYPIISSNGVAMWCDGSNYLSFGSASSSTSQFPPLRLPIPFGCSFVSILDNFRLLVVSSSPRYFQLYNVSLVSSASSHSI